MEILIVCGSLREASYNRMLANAAVEVAPRALSFVHADIGEIPPYNQDADPTYNKALSEADSPASVRRLREEMTCAAGILFVSPEYNYSIPGVLKNAIDWVSRGESPLRGKPVAIMGASMGVGGTIRMQQHIRACFQFLNAPCMLQPEIIVPTAQNRFDANGKLTDENTRKFLTAFMEAFEKWVSGHNL
jgi:chromate reductase, NAD(P)H dehydrogenase (quinone)